VSRPRERHITGHCERCGAAHDVPLPPRGSRDLGLTGVPGAFRFCVRCGRYVGRSCCWRPTAVACADCASAVPVQPAVPILASGMAGPGEEAAVGHMRSAVGELGQLAESLEAGHAVGRAGHDWIDAWTTAGLLEARIQSARDAIAKEIWDPSAATRAEAVDLDIQVRRLSALRDAALARVEIGLFARRQAARRAARPLSVRRAAWTGFVVVLLVAGIAGVASGAWTELISTAASPSASPRADPTASQGTASASVSPPSIVATPSGLIAVGEWTFDDLRMGPLGNEPELIAEGNVEVVAVPTAIDRSIALPSDRDARFCVAPDGVLGREGSMSADLNLGGDLSPASELAVALAVSADEAYRFTLRAAEFGPIDDEWIQLRLSLSELPGIRVDVTRRDGGGSVLRDSRTAERLQEPSDAAVCFWHLGDPGGGEILIDNLLLAG
jgi:hypothetical protein